MNHYLIRISLFALMVQRPQKVVELESGPVGPILIALINFLTLPQFSKVNTIYDKGIIGSKKIGETNSVSLTRVPVHCNIDGNELADIFTRQGSGDTDHG